MDLQPFKVYFTYSIYDWSASFQIQTCRKAEKCGKLDWINIHGQKRDGKYEYGEK